MVKRRTFLKTGLFGAGLLFLGGTGLAFFPTKSVASATRKLRVLDDQSFQVLVAVARRVIQDADADHVAIAQSIDESATRLPPEAQVDLRKLLSLFESALGGLVLDGRLLPFTRLAEKSQDEVLDRWRTSRIAIRRGGYQSLKKLCYVAHYSQPSSWPAIGFPTPAAVSGPYDDSKMGTPEWLKEHDLEVIP
jgi:hypothetical protein